MTHLGSPFWVPSLALQAHLNRTATGSPDDDWLSMVRARHLPRDLGRTLVIGCGGGASRARPRAQGTRREDRRGGRRRRANRPREGAGGAGRARVDLVLRLRPGAQRAAARTGGTRSSRRTCCITSDGSASCWGGSAPALSPRGRFVISEYVGPARFQYSDERMDLVARYFRMLPDRLRRDPATGRLLWHRDRVDAARLARDAPAEAARGEELVAGVRRMFDVEAEYPGAEGLLHPLLAGLAPNFGADPSGDERVMTVLCAAEARPLRGGPARQPVRLPRREATGARPDSDLVRAPTRRPFRRTGGAGVGPDLDFASGRPCRGPARGVTRQARAPAIQH
jgi:hypothetical protein